MFGVYSPFALIHNNSKSTHLESLNWCYLKRVDTVMLCLCMPLTGHVLFPLIKMKAVQTMLTIHTHFNHSQCSFHISHLKHW